MDGDLRDTLFDSTASPKPTDIGDDSLERYRKEHRKLSLLLNIVRNISSELELTKLLMLIMDEVRNVLNCERCTIFLYDELNHELFSKVAHGEAEIRFPCHLGIAGHVFTSGQPLLISDAYADKRFNPEIDKKTGYTTRNILAAAMRNKLGQIIGVFQALNKDRSTFAAEDSELLDAISTIAATQIENAQLYEAQKRIFESFIETLASTIDARDPLTAGHSERITLYAEEIAKILQLPQEECALLRTAALLHDYGKIAVRESVLCKDGRLTDKEYQHVQRHASYTRRILEKIKFTDELKDVPAIAASHHEKVDGSGYPAGLSSGDIPRLSKILAVADVFDALTSRRHYRDRMDFAKVMDILIGDSDKHFQKEFVDAFRKITMDRLVCIFENDARALIDSKDLKQLSRYNVDDFLAIIKTADPDAAQRTTISLFNKYYSREYIKDYLT